MTKYVTRFGSLAHYEKGGVEIIDDDPKRYAFSNIFEVASRSKPYEKVAVGKNMQYVLEVIRAEGTSEWWAAAHDEFALVMDGEVEVRLLKLADPSVVPPNREGSIRLRGEPAGRKMGRVQARRGPDDRRRQHAIPMGRHLPDDVRDVGTDGDHVTRTRRAAR